MTKLDSFTFEELSKDIKNKNELMKINFIKRTYDPDFSFLKGKIIKDIGFIEKVGWEKLKAIKPPKKKFS